jgi:hypothetical protein
MWKAFRRFLCVVVHGMLFGFIYEFSFFFQDYFLSFFVLMSFFLDLLFVEMNSKVKEFWDVDGLVSVLDEKVKLKSLELGMFFFVLMLFFLRRRGRWRTLFRVLFPDGGVSGN